MGQCVVAPDYPTMNEYISHGETGLLYNLEEPTAIDFSNVKDISHRAREYCEKGYETWLCMEDEIISYIYPRLSLTDFGPLESNEEKIKALNELLTIKDKMLSNKVRTIDYFIKDYLALIKKYRQLEKTTVKYILINLPTLLFKKILRFFSIYRNNKKPKGSSNK